MNLIPKKYGLFFILPFYAEIKKKKGFVLFFLTYSDFGTLLNIKRRNDTQIEMPD